VTMWPAYRVRASVRRSPLSVRGARVVVTGPASITAASPIPPVEMSACSAAKPGHILAALAFLAVVLRRPSTSSRVVWSGPPHRGRALVANAVFAVVHIRRSRWWARGIPACSPLAAPVPLRRPAV
jgi:hypothetical protein